MPREEIRSGRSTSPTGSEFFNALEEMSRDWVGRATAEVELGLKLSKKLTAAHSVPDAITAYQEWLSEEMNARAEDARLLMSKVHGCQLSTPVEQLDERQHEHVAFTCRYPLKRGAASNGEYCLRGYLWEENVNTYLQGRKITAAQDYERPSVEALQLIRKLRWIGMEEEAERVETQLHETTLAGGVITTAQETD